jgi:hypothetical protein
MMQLLRNFAGHVLPGVIKPLRVLWNEIIAWRKYKEFNGDFASLLLLMMAAVFVLLMIGYGVSSFLRARRIGRS